MTHQPLTFLFTDLVDHTPLWEQSPTRCAWQELGQRAAVAHELECFAFIAGASGQNERSAKLFGAAEALRELIGSPMTPLERREYDQAVSNLRTQMGEAALAKAWAEGRALTMEQAIEYALEKTDAPPRA